MPGPRTRNARGSGFKALFTHFDRDHHELSGVLGRYAVPLLEEVRRTQTVAELDELEKFGVTALVDTVRVQAPVVGRSFRPGSTGEGRPRWDASQSQGAPTTRHWVPFAVSGEQELLRRWPDDPPIDVEPVDKWWDAGEVFRRVEYAVTENQAYTDDNTPTWCLEAVEEREDGRMVWALYTHVDLSLEEEEAVAQGKLDLRAIVRARRDYIEPIVSAIAAQTDYFFKTKLPAVLKEQLADHRTVLTNREAVTAALTVPGPGFAPLPRVAVTKRRDEVDRSSQEQSGENEAVPEELGVAEAEFGSEEVPGPSLVKFSTRASLAPVSFEDVQRTIRRWANAVERYPGTFEQLGEERISDLLAATLNATVPDVGREVFTQNGRSDIFIKADALDADLGPATVFICEAKKATGRKAVREALDPQLFSYLNVHDTSAVLLLLLNQNQFHRSRKLYLEVLESIAGYKGTEVEFIKGWPILKFERDGRYVNVCAAFVHVRPPDKPRAKN
ncbi:hypothetical protein [Aeromicrobium sp. 179-A 4D2 NHS]|uniref:hypothetical protein n=1 Tax=Aeromicrobium sp. 179-A 4D2 NHS TaxID=3142375 RepID=UPI0039A0C16C